MEATEFINRGKELVGIRLGVSPSEVFTVWYSKSLQNHKALLGNADSDKYFELTYNGDKQEAYLDTYVKEKNEVINMLSGKPK